MIFGKDMSTLRKLMLLKAATGVQLNEYEAIGNPLTFQTNVAKPLRKLLLSWIPTQSGSGNPSPENVRPISGMSGVNVVHCGKNLFDKNATDTNNGFVSDHFLNGNVESESANYNISEYIKVKPNTGYAFQGLRGSGPGVAFYTKDKTLIVNYPYSGASSFVKTSPATAEYCRLSIYKANANVMQIEESDSVGEYEAYSGNKYAVTFPALGKNLFDEQYPDITTGTLKYKPVYVGDGAVVASTNFPITSFGAVFVIPGNVETGASTGLNNINVDTTRQAIPIDGYVTVAYRIMDGYNPVDYHVQIEKGSSATTYEPYTATVYGGSLDLTTGVLTAEWGIVDLGSVEWSASASSQSAQEVGAAFQTTNVMTTGVPTASVSTILCTNYKTIKNDSAYLGNVGIAVTVNGNIKIYDTAFYGKTKTEIPTLLTGVMVAYPLITPQTFQLSPTQITALIGNNTMWADADSLSVTYLKKG